MERAPYGDAELRAMALLEPYFGFYRTKYADNWFFFDTLPTHHVKEYDYIKRACTALNLKPYVTIQTPGRDHYGYTSSVTLCDYGIIEFTNNIENITDQEDYSNDFAGYKDIKLVTQAKHTWVNLTTLTFGESGFLDISNAPKIGFDGQSFRNEEIIRKLCQFLKLINEDCKIIEKTTFL